MKQGERCLSLSAYITANAVRQYFSSVAGREESIRRIQRIGIRKAYVEFYRSGLLLDGHLLAEVKYALERAGFEVSGGIATTHGEGFTDKSTAGYYWVCFTSEKSRRNLERAMRVGAKIFDQIIVDDFLCTGCRCPRCKKRKGNRDWKTFHGDLMVEFARQGIIKPAKEENPAVKLIIKYPQWYDRFHVFGYDVLRQSEAFDAVWVGTEIRDLRKDYVYQYQPFSNFTYITSVAGDKVEGAWFDHLWCYPEIYVEQAYQSVLAGAHELVLFSYDPQKYDENNPNTRMLMEKKPILQKVCSELRGKKPIGIEAYKPPGSDPLGEAYLFDYLGLMGLPTIVSARRPSTKSLILPAHALSDPRIGGYLKDMGPDHMVLATSGFIEGLRDDSLVKGLFGLSDEPVGRKQIFTYRFAIEGKERLGEERVLVRSYLRSGGAKILASALGGKAFPILTLNQAHGNTYLAASLDTFRYLPVHGSAAVTTAEPVSLVHLPQEFVDLLRGVMLGPFGMSMKAPPRVALYLYSSERSSAASVIVLENFSDQDAEVELTANVQLKPLRDDRCVERTSEGLRVRIPRRDIELLSSPSG